MLENFKKNLKRNYYYKIKRIQRNDHARRVQEFNHPLYDIFE